MKTSFISSLSVQTTMRNSIAAAQRDLVKANEEAVSGRFADIGVVLGANTARALDLTRDITRIDSLHSTAALATQRLESAELALSNMAELGNKMQNAILTLGSATDETNLATARMAMTSALQDFMNFANTSVNGEYIFAGIDSDTKPFEDILGGNAKAAFDREFDHFLANREDGPITRDQMTAEDMEDFLDGIEAKFQGGEGNELTSPPHPEAVAGQDFWTTYVSAASDENMKSRISPTELVESSTNANSPGMRSFVLSAIVSTTFMQADMPKEAREAATTRTTTFIGKATDGLNLQRTNIGIHTERVSKAEESLKAQKDILTTHLGTMQNVDAAEAATRVNTLQTLLETAYSVTAKIQRLSLVNYL